MTAVKERFMQMLPQSLPEVPDDEVQYMINILVKWNTPEKTEKKLAADGILHHLADPSKIPGEEGAWKRAAVEKYRQQMEEMNEVD